MPTPLMTVGIDMATGKRAATMLLNTIMRRMIVSGAAKISALIRSSTMRSSKVVSMATSPVRQHSNSPHLMSSLMSRYASFASVSAENPTSILMWLPSSE